MNKRGITRGYPWKDFSVLPEGFKTTGQGFFYIADEAHNPERKERWSEPYLCLLARTWMVTCSCAIYHGDEFLGVVAIDVDLGKIIEPLSCILNNTRGSYAFVVSPSGNLIISSDEGMDRLRDESVLLTEKWEEMRGSPPRLAGNIEVGEVTLASGRAYLLHCEFTSNEWNLICILPRVRGRSVKAVVPVAIEDSGLALEQPPSDKEYQPLISFVSSFNESLRQIKKLIEGTAIIGRGVLDHRIAVERKDEIGLLAISINKMAAELRKREAEVDFAYKKISQMDRLSALGRLTAGIAHEINNPLGIISSYIQILARNPKLDSDVQRDIQTIEEEIRRASEIIRRLLNFSGRTNIEKSVVCVNDVLQKTLGLLRFQLKSQHIELLEHYDDALPFTMGSPTHLQQAFLNILLNAGEAMAEGGTLELRTRYRERKTGDKRKGVVEISIADTGHGIEKTSLDKIFDPFFTLKGRGRGLGLGLSISYGIIKDHGGNIEVRSRRGKGTKAKITLPAVDL
ncbi:MAG: ATP-binding protein [Syntrophorhabdales bacterium]|jgi:signal transduction histidine kinase